MTISYDPETPSLAETETREVAPHEPRAIPAGLCASCAEASECGFRWTPGQAVLQCDEYRPGMSVPGVAGEDAVAAREEEMQPRLGLCAPCARRPDCTYARGRYGVWSCAEYE